MATNKNSVNVSPQPAAESMAVVKQQTPATGTDRPREFSPMHRKLNAAMAFKSGINPGLESGHL